MSKFELDQEEQELLNQFEAGEFKSVMPARKENAAILKAERERKIFQLFARSIGVDVGNSKIESRNPPEPDILLTYPDGGFSAFEMVEILDQDYSNALQRQLAFRKSCYQYLEKLPIDKKNQFRDKFSNADIFISFKENITLNRRKSLLPKIFNELFLLPKDISGDVLESNSSLKKEIDYATINRGNFNGPMFDASSYVWVGEPAVEAITLKHDKTYVTCHEINLLAYIETNPMFPEEVWISNLKEHFNELNESCQFSNIYVFDCQSEKVKITWRKGEEKKFSLEYSFL